jgi:hypothetical protein
MKRMLGGREEPYSAGRKIWEIAFTHASISPDVVWPLWLIDVDQEYGDWGISGDVYFTMTRGWLRGGQKRPVRHRESYFDDAYLVRRLTPLEFVYESVASGDVYSVRKVGADFTL